MKKILETIDKLIEATSEKRWVFGTKKGKWYLVGKDDRDWKYAITQKELKKLGTEEAKEKYLGARMVK